MSESTNKYPLGQIATITTKAGQVIVGTPRDIAPRIVKGKPVNHLFIRQGANNEATISYPLDEIESVEPANPQACEGCG